MADKTQGQTVITALIIPLSSASPPPRPSPGPTPPGGGERPDNTLPGDIPRPEHPIYYPLPPGVPVYPDNALPGEQPGIDNTLPGQQPKPDQGLPGEQPEIDNSLPEGGGGWLPVYIWGPTDPRPGTGLPGEQPGIDNTLPPIEEPPPVEVEGAQVKWVCGWTPSTGWVSVAIVVPGDRANVPTPSKAKRK